MNIKPTEILKNCTLSLTPIFDEREAQAISRLIIQEYLDIDRAKLMINDDFHLLDDQAKLLNEVIHRLKKNEPIQHIIGTAHFYGREFHVNQDVLIPRPETEELVDLIIKENQNKASSILDIGTGSGCIPITLAKELPACSLYTLDISSAALNVAMKNASIHHASIQFYEIDILQNEPTGQYDIIVSNPPYITNKEKKLMHANVLDFEPSQALFVPDENPLLFYKRIAEISRIRLHNDGILYFEINEHYGPETVKLIEELGFRNTRLIKDLSDKDRIVVGQWSH